MLIKEKQNLSEILEEFFQIKYILSFIINIFTLFKIWRKFLMEKKFLYLFENVTFFQR